MHLLTSNERRTISILRHTNLVWSRLAQLAPYAIIPYMTKLLEEAIKKVRELPVVQQDEVAAMLLSVASKNEELVELDDETRAAVRVGREQARRGEFVNDRDMAAFFRRHGIARYGA
jgi:hypothetical protein